MARRMVVGIAIFIAICVLAAWWSWQHPENAEAKLWFSIVPPFAAIILAFVTRRVILSLTIAVLLGGFICIQTENLPKAFIKTDIAQFKANLNDVEQEPIDEGQIDEEPIADSSPWLVLPNLFYAGLRIPANFQVLIFIPLMFAMVVIIADARGFDGIINFVSRFVKGRKSAQLATASAGVLYFFDDYSNAMVVGATMRPLTDRFRVSREKLAFLVDSTSAPIASLALVSTWIMYEVGFFKDVIKDVGLENITGYEIFLDILQYRFYCIFILALVFLHIFLGRDFGPMKAAEERALKATPDRKLKENNTAKPPSVLVAIEPLAGLILFHFAGMWYCGARLEGKGAGLSPTSFKYWQEVIGGSADYVILIFDFAALFGLILAINAAILANFPFNKICRSIWKGVATCAGPCMILILAWALKSCSDALNTKVFLAALIEGNVPLVALPMIVFLVACVTSFTTGTSWGTMGILIPMVGSVAFQLEGHYGLITMMCLGAVLDGAIFGDHCSPISDTTILSSTASQCELMPHVRTQMPYSILGASVAVLIGYLPVALGLAWIISIPLGILAIIAFFLLVGKRIETPHEFRSERSGPN